MLLDLAERDLLLHEITKVALEWNLKLLLLLIQKTLTACELIVDQAHVLLETSDRIQEFGDNLQGRVIISYYTWSFSNLIFFNENY